MASSSERQDGLAVVGVFLGVLAVLGMIFGVGLGMRAIDKADNVRTTGGGGGSSVSVTLTEFKIDPAMISVTPGSTLKVTNKGSSPHNLTVKEKPELTTGNIDAGKSKDLDLSSLPAGDYTVICSIPGHEGAGMTAMLMVGASGSAASPTTPTTAMSADAMDAAMKGRTAAFPAKTNGTGALDLAPKVLADGTKEFDLTASVFKWEVEPGKTVDAWGYNNMVPGPTIRVKNGDKVKVVLKNELPESTVIHFHGLTVPNAMDGVPDITQPPVKPGSSFTYEFTAKGPAVAMYHSHHDAQKQVANGMLGAFYVDDMPLPAGTGNVTTNIPMVLNDNGTIGYSLNAKSFPATAPIVAKQGDWVKVDYMNEGSQIHPMHLHGMPQLVIAQDGYPLNQPQLEDTVMVAPGQRVSVLVHATEKGAWAWHCHILPHAENEQGMYGMVTALVVQ